MGTVIMSSLFLGTATTADLAARVEAGTYPAADLDAFTQNLQAAGIQDQDFYAAVRANDRQTVTRLLYDPSRQSHLNTVRFWLDEGRTSTPVRSHEISLLLDQLDSGDAQTRLNVFVRLLEGRDNLPAFRERIGRILALKARVEEEVSNRQAMQELLRLRLAFRSHPLPPQICQAKREGAIHPLRFRAAMWRVLVDVIRTGPPKPRPRPFLDRLAEDYNRYLPADAPPVANTTFHQHVSGKRTKQWLVELLAQAGIVKENRADIKRARVRWALREATERIRAGRGTPDFKNVIPLAYHFYCTELTKSEWPSAKSFRQLFYGDHADSSLLDFLDQLGVAKQRRAALDPGAAQVALQKAQAQLGESAADFARARLAHLLYIEQHPGAPHPTVQAFRRLLERSRGSERQTTLGQSD